MAALLLATAAYGFFKEDVDFGGALRVLFVISGGTFGLILAYAVIIRQLPADRLGWLAWVQVGGDIALAAVLLWLTGGSDSPFAFLFSYGVINAAILLYRRGALLAAGISTLSYAAVTLAMRAGWLAPVAEYLRPDPVILPRLVFSLTVNSAAFVLVAILGAYLAEQVRQAGVRVVEAEADLAALSELHERIVRSVPSGILTLSAGGEVTFLNPAGSDILGLPVSEAIGRKLEEVMPNLEGDLHGRGAEDARGEIELPGGTILGYAVTALGGEGEQVVVFQDLSSLKQMERRVRRAERLAALGSLAAGLAHEIRNPLASMSGSIELLRSTVSEGETSRELMAIVLREIERLEGLIADFLAFARPRTPEIETVDLSLLVEEVVRLVRNDPRVSGSTIECEVPAGLEIAADPGQVRQVLINLLLNAAESREGARVVVRARAEGEAIVLEVEDDGPGMSSEVQEHIFDPFFTTKQRGTGLGLALVHAILEAHGAEIAVESRLEAGTRFRILFPVRRKD